MIVKLEVYSKREDDIRDLFRELKERGYDVTTPYYTNGYGAPVNYAGVSGGYPAPTEGEVDGD